jgi:transcription elongation factor Elf1
VIDLTPEQKAAYIDAPSKCPSCKSEDIEGGVCTIDDTRAEQEVRCLNCDAFWMDVYKLVDVEELS